MKIYKIDATKGKTIRVNLLDHVDPNLRKSFEEIRDRDGIETCYDALIKIYGDDMDDQIKLLIKSN